ncbi:hypothetical protein [uncultured Tateyamaria sp.]|uniref:hypothetical protein n=1 Tax=uncultured Tateyamaria sp. TaxID=455651 RepID=UPI0026022A61|nr:hypothetical protein [uncultured Tateyamaria sp.]
MDEGSSNIRWHAKLGSRDAWAQQSHNPMVAVIAVGVVGAVLVGAIASFVWPPAVAAGGLFGFVGAIVLRGIWLSRRTSDAQDEYAHGNARTEEKVRKALAEIKGREK